MGGVGAGDAVALPLVVGGGGRPGLAEVQRPAGGDGQLPLLPPLLSLLLLPERDQHMIQNSRVLISHRWSQLSTSFRIAAEIPPKSEQPDLLVGQSCWEVLLLLLSNSYHSTTSQHDHRVAQHRMRNIVMG